MRFKSLGALHLHTHKKEAQVLGDTVIERLLRYDFLTFVQSDKPGLD